MKTIETKKRSVVSLRWDWGEKADSRVQYKEPFMLTELFCAMILAVDIGLDAFAETHWTLQHKEWILFYVNLKIGK